MVDWKLLALTVPLAFVIFQTLAKLVPKGISSLLIAVYALATGALMMAVLYLLTSGSKSLQLPPKTLLLATVMGLFVALGNFGVIKAFALGAPQSAFTILFYITLIVYGLIFGVAIWHEKLRLIQVVGIALACAGVFVAVYFKK